MEKTLDFSQRISNEYTNLIDSGCWTWRAGSQSSKLSDDSTKLIDQRYPHYKIEMASFNARHPLFAGRIENDGGDLGSAPKVLCT